MIDDPLVAIPSCQGCNVVLISIDTLRADHLGVYGYERDTSPRLDRWAEEAVIFENAVAQSPNTLLSHMSLFTGLYPLNHGVLSENHRLPDETVTLADVLHEDGYETAAFTGGGFVREKFNYHTFDYFTHSNYWDPHVAGRRQFGEMLEWVESTKEPFFLFWHTYKVHSPYSPLAEFDRFTDPLYDGPVDPDPAESVPICEGPKKRQCNWKGTPYYDLLIDQMTPRDIQHVRDKYDGEILEIDTRLEELRQTLEGLGLDQRTVVIFTSDHGETFADRPASRMIGHGAVYREVLRVPLIIWVPGARPLRVGRTVELMSLMPTILEILGFEPPKDVDATSILAQLDPLSPAKAARAQFPLRNLYSVEYAGFKLIQKGTGQKATIELYDLKSDSGETRNLAGNGHPMEEELRALLVTERSGGVETSKMKMDEETRKELQALGYL